MKPSEKIKSAELSSAKELSEITGIHINTLFKWHKTRPELFDIIVRGAAAKVDKNSDDIFKWLYFAPSSPVKPSKAEEIKKWWGKVKLLELDK